MHVDQDGETILETLAELERFEAEAPCAKCRSEARRMLNLFAGGDRKLRLLVFTTTCSHGV